MRIFLTGATGVIGRRVVPALLAQNHTITAPARTLEKRAALTAKGVNAIECDLYDLKTVLRVVEGHDTIINLATAIPQGIRSMLVWAWKENSRIRKEVSANLRVAASAAGVKRFVQESFAPVYPDRGSEWIGETVPLKPVAYNKTVLDAERAAMRFAEGGGTAVVLRFAFLYGPNDPFTDTVVNSVRKGWFPVPGKPDAYVSLVHHNDAAHAVVAALEIPGGVYNVVENEPRTRQKLGATIAQALGVRPPRILPGWLTLLTGSSGKMLLRSERISNRKLRSTGRWQAEAIGIEELAGIREGLVIRPGS